MLHITVDLSGTYDAAVHGIRQHEAIVKKATQRALNKTARWLQTQVARDVAQDLDLKVRLVRAGLTVISARQSSLTSTVGLKTTSGVIKGKQLGKIRQTPTGTKAGSRHYDHAFPATMASGHEGVFKRVGKTRLPIREQVIIFTGRLAQFLAYYDTNGSVQHQLKRVFEREYRYLSELSRFDKAH